MRNADTSRLNNMKVCIIGCGAIGGMLAAFLARAEVEVTVIDKGTQYAALRERGLTLVDTSDAKIEVDTLRVETRLPPGESFDALFLAVKAHEIETLAADISHALGDSNLLITLQNGLPWWYFQRYEGALAGKVLQSTDPGGRLTQLIDPEQILGCVAYPAAEVTAPGVIRHLEGIRFPLGELDGRVTGRAESVSNLLVSAGLKSPVLTNIREEIWLKAWGNMAFNPISALTHATMADIARFQPTRDYVAELMREAEEVAHQLGIRFRVPLERRLEGAEKVGAHKTSMLQDVLANRPLETDAILGSIVEMASLVEIKVPQLSGLYAMTRLRDRVNGDAQV
ncbi:MAG: 2-dehydropantoate 2-reductase [Pseudomonadota bacterium]